MDHKVMMKPLLHAVLLGSTALTFAGGPLRADDADCVLVDGLQTESCARTNAGTAVNMEAPANSEWDSGQPESPTGFVLSIDGATVLGDRRIEDRIRATDLALSAANVQVKFDGLNPTKRLDLEIEGSGTRNVTLQSRVNYPRFVSRAEMRVIDLAARGGPKTIRVLPVQPNGTVSVQLPAEGDLRVVHRVYDAQGRYDETMAVSLEAKDNRGLIPGVEDGSSSLAVNRIPVRGGAVTVSGDSVAPGGTVQTLGESIRPAPDGSFVLQRILPAGAYEVDVSVRGPGALNLTREIEIPRSEWFYVGVADLTYGTRKATGQPRETYTRGRLSGYAKGITQRGYTITASVDTREEDLKYIFRNLDRKDPRSVLLRIDPSEFYPVYGDDSTYVEDAPTFGRVYVKIEKNGNHLTWGNAQSEVRGSEYLRNERMLYGLSGKWASNAQTTHGEPRAEISGYASQPDNLPQRDVFRGTGGSIYFLTRQDVSRGSETVAAEVRDRITGRVISRQFLTYGTDYEVNYIQGLVTLTRPLSGSASNGVVITNPGGDYDVNLVVQYEYTPIAGNLSGYSVGGRAQVWATDSLRIGVTAQKEETGPADQKTRGVDLHYRLGERSYVEAEYAESDGPGFGNTYSFDGGLVVTTNPAAAGTGAARRVKTLLDLQELGFNREGTFTAYAENRDSGFSTLDYSVTADERLSGFALDIKQNEKLSWSLYHDQYRSAAGNRSRESGLELSYLMNDRDTLSLGIESIERVSTAETGDRTDIALRYDRKISDDLSWYVVGQVTAKVTGLDKNNRLAFGGSYKLNDRWTVEGEVSGGSLGPGGRILASYADGDRSSRYFGYEFDPSTSLVGAALSGQDHGRFVIGAREQINDSVVVSGESSYDLLGSSRTLTQAYGVEYSRSDYLTYSINLEGGTVKDDNAGSNLDRWAVSLGARYEDERLAARARLEFRQDKGQITGTNRDGETIALSLQARYQIDDAQRLLFSFDGIDTATNSTSITDSTYADAVIGYALRPIDNDKLNVLLKYRFLYDKYGQEIDGLNARGPKQVSHVFSIDGEYDLNDHWTLGGKVGFRKSKTAAQTSTVYADNDAWLAVVNARYHVVHNWDMLFELRQLKAVQAGTTETGALAAVYRHFGNNMKLGVGYNFGSFSDDLTDLTLDDKGVFVNLVAKF